MTDELLDFERRHAARDFVHWGDSMGSSHDEELAYRIAKLIGTLTFDESERRVSVWQIDGTYIVVAAWAPGEQDPDMNAMILADFRKG